MEAKEWAEWLGALEVVVAEAAERIEEGLLFARLRKTEWRDLKDDWERGGLGAERGEVKVGVSGG